MEKKYNGPKRIAHRGVISAAPENTLSAFKAAVSGGLEGIEIDIRLTKDKEIVVAHDVTLTRLLAGHSCYVPGRKINEMTWEELSGVQIPYAGHLLNFFPQNGFINEKWYYYPWMLDEPEKVAAFMVKLEQQVQSESLDCREEAIFSRMIEHYRKEYENLFIEDPRTEKFILLKDLLTWLKEQPEDFLIEIEYKEGGMMPYLAELLDKSGVGKRCIVFSGIEELNMEIQSWFGRNGKPEGLKLGANIRFPEKGLLENIRSFDLYEVGLNAGCFTEDDVCYFEDRGIHVFSNLGDYPKWWAEIQKLGIYGFKTNCANQYTKWWQEVKIPMSSIKPSHVP